MNWQISAAIISLVPVLIVGCIIAEILMLMHPRRGKRPDIATTSLGVSYPNRVTVVRPSGQFISGPPVLVALRFGQWVMTVPTAIDALKRLGERGTLLLGELDSHLSD